MPEQKDTLVVESPRQFWRAETRREFLRLLGMGGSVVLLPSVFAACDDDDDDDPTGPGPVDNVTLNLSNDTGILNFAFALEQLEAAFYTAVVGSAAFNGMAADPKEVLGDIRLVEVVHAEFYRRLLGTNGIGQLKVDQAAVNATLASAATILQTAEMIEDTGVAAYNGAGKYLTDPNNLTVAGKIVSVEARHAAAIRDVRAALGVGGATANVRFAGDDIVNAQGLDVKLEAGVVLTRVLGTGLPDTTITIGTAPPNKPGTPDQAPPTPTP